eukprot:NODE_1874_length_2348_cov_6.305268.p1 GENE.NODE_1874_length_2348_cov_6.305268~~NODE_1874_length_2348_cov_6.305268.p1  ORF type:complete len:689 (-),score=153.55 NODE_1874_length_2348_cov_6.305268:282-2246(-)
MGLTSLVGYSFNMIHFWFLLFFITGLGMDDMFFLALTRPRISAKDIDCHALFRMNLAQVMMPISMTSLINAAVFLMLFLVIDIPAVYIVCVTGFFGVVLAWAMNMFTFSLVAYYDFVRQDRGRIDCCCCVKQSGSADHGNWTASPCCAGFLDLLKDKIYLPMLRNKAARIVIVALCVILTVVLAAFGLSDIPVGLQLQDLTIKGTVAHTWSMMFWEHFSSYSITLVYKDVSYESPTKQMQMAREFENLLQIRLVDSDDVQTSLVWTAALAVWAMPAEYNLGPCMASDFHTQGNCGPNVDARCTATWVENIYNLRLASEDGVARNGTDIGLTSSVTYFPVMDVNISTLAHCVKLWKTYSSTQYNLLSPELMFLDGEVVTPIRYSHAATNYLYTKKLKSVDDYVELIGDARDVVDDDDSVPSFLDGVPFEFFEQYATIIQKMFRSVVISIVVGFVASFTFLVSDLAPSRRFSIGRVLALSILHSGVLAVFAAICVLIVVPILSFCEINFSVFTLMIVLMTVAFSMEFNVHTVRGYLVDDAKGTNAEKVCRVFDYVFEPMVLGFITTTFSALFTAVADFTFIRKYMFLPLISTLIVTFLTSFIVFPAALSFLPGMALDETTEPDQKVDTDPIASVIGSQQQSSDPPEEEEQCGPYTL